MNESNLKVAQVSGIDAVYYFGQSGGFYNEFYLDILNQVETKRKEFESLDYAYQDSDITITINKIDIKYSGKGRDGFLWFNHKFFRAGFKEDGKNANIHNIRIQLNAVGIYTLGITSLLEYIKLEFLRGALLEDNYFPITRVDINMFIQHNFDYLNKDMLVSKKKTNESIIGEYAGGYALQTFVVGKKPFKLRIYNKLEELKGATDTKKEMMLNYFAVNGLDLDKPIWNVEFELHREFLKQYGIDTVIDALNRSKNLFELCCELIRFIDSSTITDKQLISVNRRRADTLPIWDFISTHYDNKEFMQITTPLSKIDKISYRYGLEDAKKTITRTVKRLMIHQNTPTLFFFQKILQEVKDEFALQRSIDDANSEFVDAQVENCTDEYKSYSSPGLLEFEESLAMAMKNEEYGSEDYNEISAVYSEVFDELVERGLKKPLPF